MSYLYVFSGPYQARRLGRRTSAAAGSEETAGRFPGNKSGGSRRCRVRTFTGLQQPPSAEATRPVNHEIIDASLPLLRGLAHWPQSVGKLILPGTHGFVMLMGAYK